MRPHRSSSMIIKKVFRVMSGLVLLFALVPAVSTCEPTCTGGLRPYHGMCLTNTAIVYMECTKGHGFDTTQEIAASGGGTFKVVADATLKLAYKKAKKENKDVSLQIVHDCFKIAGQASDSSPEDRKVAQTYERQANREIKQWETEQVVQTPHIKLSSKSAKVGDAVQVSGTNFYPNETVDIHLHATLVEQVEADGQGTFRVTIEVPNDAPPPGFSTTISATGETSAKSAKAPFVVAQ